MFDPRKKMKSFSKSLKRHRSDSSSSSDSEGGQPCLICLRPGGESLSKIKAFSLSTSKEDSVLEPHLNSLFIIRHLLEMRRGICVHLLKSTRLNPGGWFSLCDKCSKVVMAGLQIHLNLTDEPTMSLTKIQKKLKAQLQQSLDEQFPGDDENDDDPKIGEKTAYQLIRELYADDGGVKKDEETSSEEEENDRGTTRRAAAKRARKATTWNDDSEEEEEGNDSGLSSDEYGFRGSRRRRASLRDRRPEKRRKAESDSEEGEEESD